MTTGNISFFTEDHDPLLCRDDKEGLRFIQQTLVFPSSPPSALATTTPTAAPDMMTDSLFPPEEQQQQQQSSIDEVILFSKVNEMSIQNTTNHLEAIAKIWSAEKFCSGGLLRGRLSNDKRPPSLDYVEEGDLVLYPRSVGELAGGSRRKTKNIKARGGSDGRSLSPMKSQQTGDSTRQTQILFTEGRGATLEKFTSVLASIVENDRAKYS